MKTFLTNGTILTPDRQLDSSDVVVEGEKIVGINPASLPEPGARVIDACGKYIIPGMLDIHIHGAHGADAMDASVGALHTLAGFIASHGVTAYLPTTLTASPQDILEAIRTVAGAPQPPSGARHLGIHLEGPYLDHNFCGAQPPQHLRHPDPAEYQAWFDSQAVRLITLAPEVPGAFEFIRAGLEKGVEFAVGHSAATYEQVMSAIQLGLRQVTHTFNGMPPLHHREPGILGAVLGDERVFAQVIADGIHVHHAVVKLLVKAKGIHRTILITDAIRATGMPDGAYTLGDQTVHVKDGVARTAAGGLAGSTLTMERALYNAMRFTGLSLREALPMATRVPAEALGLQGQKGRIAPGYDADLVILDRDCQVLMTMVGGQVVYRND